MYRHMGKHIPLLGSLPMNVWFLFFVPFHLCCSDIATRVGLLKLDVEPDQLLQWLYISLRVKAKALACFQGLADLRLHHFHPFVLAQALPVTPCSSSRI